MNKQFPFYWTWSKQDSPHYFDITETKDFHYILKDNQPVLDFSSTSFQNGFGLKPRFLIEALKNQIDFMPTASPKSNFELKDKVSKDLIKLINQDQSDSGKILYTVSGAESVENALKLAREVSGSKIVLARQNSYHGATLGALSITGDWRNEAPQTVDEWTQRIPEPHDDLDLSKTEAIIKKVGPEKIAAFCLETITGANGVIIPEQEWWDGIQMLCKKYDIFLIVDEVTCGFYRTGLPFGFHHFNVKPDFVCMSKIIGGGVIPFGALWTSDKIYNYFQHTKLSTGLTQYAHPLGLAVLKEILEKFKNQEFKKQLEFNIKSLADMLKFLSKQQNVKSIRQIGLLAAVDHTLNISWDDCIKKGIYLMVRPKMLVLAPALNIGSKEIEEAQKKLVGLLTG